MKVNKRALKLVKKHVKVIDKVPNYVFPKMTCSFYLSSKLGKKVIVLNTNNMKREIKNRLKLKIKRNTLTSILLHEFGHFIEVEKYTYEEYKKHRGNYNLHRGLSAKQLDEIRAWVVANKIARKLKLKIDKELQYKCLELYGVTPKRKRV